MTDSQELINRMVRTFPALHPMLSQHLEEMEGELLPYLLLADVARWAEVEVGRDPRAVTELVNWLEHEFNQGEGPEKDLIGLGFVETIPRSPTGHPLLDMLGPSLRQVAEELGLLN